MKKIIIVNNNMKVGGIQKSLCNLLWSIHGRYDVTLLLFQAVGDYMNQIPADVHVLTTNSLFRFLGISQCECASIRERLQRGSLAFFCKLFGRPAVLRYMLFTQKTLPEEYDCAISFLHNGDVRHFYGGVNEFVLFKVRAQWKAAFLHCDYQNCGANHPVNNRLYQGFDRIAACSDGCRRSFAAAAPEWKERCVTVRNFHRDRAIRRMAHRECVAYRPGEFHLLFVGRLAHEKAVDRAIRAVAYAIERGIPVSLHIVGSGAMLVQLKELALMLNIGNAVCFYGEQTNPYRFMPKADLLLVTSYHEAAPMVIDEARIVGLPVLTVETTSSTEMVLDRQCGWVCENTQACLNEALTELLCNASQLEEMKKSLEDSASDWEETFRQFQLLIGD